MSDRELLGIVVVTVAGLIMGTVPWPLKVIRRFQFEHTWFVGMLVGLIIIPWVVTLSLIPNALEAYRAVDASVLIKANLFAMAWGIANVLGGMCYIRIGVALTVAILTGLGVSIGVTMPMIVKASGLFQDAPDLGSDAGRAVLVGVAVMLVGVVFVSMAGFGRDQVLQKKEERRGNFLGGLIMASVAGILSCGISFAFVYSQGPIVQAMKAQGAGDTAANISVWAIGLMGGALINILYPAYLMTRNRNWGVLRESGKEIVLAAALGSQILLAVAIMGKGMLLMGALGASIGFGIQQAMQIMGGQGLGFLTGEWRGIHGKPRTLMYLAIACLLIASLIMAYGNSLAKS